MQDGLKARMWDPQEKMMHYNDFVITSTGYVAKVETYMETLGKFVIDQTDLDFDKKMVVMRCTGLEDENGKLVYEGDIMRGLRDNTLFVISYEDKYASFKIKEIFPTDYTKWSITDARHFEIIGNIYENPELLKGEENEFTSIQRTTKKN